MSMAGRMLRRLARARWRRLQRAVAEPLAVQRRVLRSLLIPVSRTVFGRDYGLDRLEPSDLDAFRRTMPLTTYESVYEYWQRAYYGEPDVIWPGQIRYWGMTSGTTSAAGHNKFIPITHRTIKSNKDGGLVTLAPYFVHSDDSSLFNSDSKGLFLGGSTTFGEIPNRHNPHGLPNYYGDNTGIMARHIPPWVRRFYAPGKDIAAIVNWEEKLEAIAERTRHEDIRMVSGVPSWMAILFDRIREKEHGRPIGEVWPNLRLFIHGGMNFAPYRELFHELIDREILYIDSYTATESGAISVQDLPGGPDHEDTAQLVIPDLETFYEFVPVEEAEKEFPESHTLDEIEADVEYAIVMTTNQGLLRYVVGDTVRFVDTSPPRFYLTGRLSAFLNFFGEHVTVREMDQALGYAAKRAHVAVKEYTVGAILPSPNHPTPQHRWYVEFQNKPPADMEAFARDIDKDLREHSLNRDYDAHRKGDHGLLPPVVQPVPPETFYVWMKRRKKLGAQNKVPRVLTPELEPSLCETLQELQRVTPRS